MPQAEDRTQGQEKPTAEQELLTEARDRLRVSVEGWKEVRDHALDDLKFRNGEHWPEAIKRDREAESRPCLTINLMDMFLDQVIGAQRQVKPMIKVRPVEDIDVEKSRVKNRAGNRDYTIADVYTGLIRNIEYQSKAEAAYDTAFEHAADRGFGFFRVVTEYAHDETFAQDIRIKRIKNPFSVLIDPDFEDEVAADMRWCFITRWLTHKEHDRLYKTDSREDFGAHAMSEEFEKWYEPDKIRVAEYFRRVPVENLIVLLDNGTVLNIGEGEKQQKARRAEIEAQGGKIVRERIAKTSKVQWCEMNGAKILKPLRDFPCRYIPVIPVWGKELNLDGKTVYRSVIRNAKDPQRMLNYWETANTEAVALQPKAPYIGTHLQFSKNPSHWESANTTNAAYLAYEPDPLAPGAPKREAPPQASSAMIERSRTAYEHLLNTTGIQRASLGQQGDEKSGIAIRERKEEGDTATFPFTDNLTRAIGHCGRILVDMIPRIYVDERVIRLRTPDEKEDFVAINQRLADETIVHDLGVGKYDVIVDVGPGYTTQRQEAAASMLEFIQAVPAAGPVMADLIAKIQDWPEADEIARRLDHLVPAELKLKPGDPPPPPKPPTPAEQAELLKQQAAIIKAQADMAKAQAEMAQTPQKVCEVVAEAVLELFAQLGILTPEQRALLAPAGPAPGPVAPGPMPAGPMAPM